MDGAPFLEPRHEALRAKGQKVALRLLEPLDGQAEHDVDGAGREAARILGREGLLRCVVPEAWGGEGKDVEVRSIAAAREGVAYGSGLGDAMLALQGLGSFPLLLAGTEAQRKAWLPKVAKGEAIGAFAMTEPEAGSDVAAMATRATRTREGWLLQGTKTFISNAGIADYYALFAKTDPAAGAKGISAFLLPADAAGLRTEPLRAMAPHPLGTVHLDGVRLPPEALLGQEGQGLRLALQTLDRMRPTVAAAACGLAGRALDASLARARERHQFGAPIGDHQGLRWKLAEAATDLDAARLLVHRAAWRKDMGQERISLEGAQAKLFATEAAQRIVDLCVQIHGGKGVLAGGLPDKLYREVRALRIYEGTSEVLRDIVGKALLADAGQRGSTAKHSSPP
jgi:acyl-CoA dehydrogenase